MLCECSSNRHGRTNILNTSKFKLIADQCRKLLRIMHARMSRLHQLMCEQLRETNAFISIHAATVGNQRVLTTH